MTGTMMFRWADTTLLVFLAERWEAHTGLACTHRDWAVHRTNIDIEKLGSTEVLFHRCWIRSYTIIT